MNLAAFTGSPGSIAAQRPSTRSALAIGPRLRLTSGRQPFPGARAFFAGLIKTSTNPWFPPRAHSNLPTTKAGIPAALAVGACGACCAACTRLALAAHTTLLNPNEMRTMTDGTKRNVVVVLWTLALLAAGAIVLALFWV